MKTAQTLYPPALECVPTARGSSLCPINRVRAEWTKWAKKNSGCKIRNRSPYGSGECIGAEGWRMYCVHWKTLKAKLLRKSLADSKPETGRNWKPVLSARKTAKLSTQKLRLHLVTFLIQNILTSEEGGNLLELRDLLLAVSALLLQLLQGLKKLPAGQMGVDAPELAIDLPPVHRHKHTEKICLHLHSACIFPASLTADLTMWTPPGLCTPPQAAGPPCYAGERLIKWVRENERCTPSQTHCLYLQASSEMKARLFLYSGSLYPCRNVVRLLRTK